MEPNRCSGHSSPAFRDCNSSGLTGGTRGKLVTWVATVLQRTLVIVKRPRHTQGFQVLQWRWIVERTFGWLNRSRRLSKDFEALPETTEAWIRIAMIHLMVRRLAARA